VESKKLIACSLLSRKRSKRGLTRRRLILTTSRKLHRLITRPLKHRLHRLHSRDVLIRFFKRQSFPRDPPERNDSLPESELACFKLLADDSHFDFLARRYGHLREFAPAFLQAFPFRSNLNPDPLLGQNQLPDRAPHAGRRPL